MNLLKLPRPFTTPRDISLPAIDHFCYLHGEPYEPFLKARASRLSTRTTAFGMKFRRRYELLSMNELRILLSLCFNPYVVDIREQYAIFNDEDYWRAYAAGKRMLRTDVRTIDFYVTHLLPGSVQLHNHGISIKEPSYVPNEKERRREEWEKQTMAEMNGTWELVRGDAVSSREFANNWAMYRTIREQNARALYDQALWFSKRLLSGSTRGTMDSVLARVSRALGIAEDDGHRLFAVGASFGFLTVDHEKELLPSARLHLIR
ncbi:hypothetical protein [Burkholderia orbicola]